MRHIVDEAHTKTVELVRANKDKLDALAQELLDHEIVDGSRVYEIVGNGRTPQVDEPLLSPG